MLEQENIKLNDENRELTKRLQGIAGVETLDEIEENILVLLSSTNQELTVQMIASSLQLNLTRVEYYLEKMYDTELVLSNDWTDDRPSEYYLAQKGREYLVKNDLLE